MLVDERNAKIPLNSQTYIHRISSQSVSAAKINHRVVDPETEYRPKIIEQCLPPFPSAQIRVILKDFRTLTLQNEKMKKILCSQWSLEDSFSYASNLVP